MCDQHPLASRPHMPTDSVGSCRPPCCHPLATLVAPSHGLPSSQRGADQRACLGPGQGLGGPPCTQATPHGSWWRCRQGGPATLAPGEESEGRTPSAGHVEAPQVPAPTDPPSLGVVSCHASPSCTPALHP